MYYSPKATGLGYTISYLGSGLGSVTPAGFRNICVPVVSRCACMLNSPCLRHTACQSPGNSSSVPPFLFPSGTGLQSWSPEGHHLWCPGEAVDPQISPKASRINPATPIFKLFKNQSRNLSCFSGFGEPNWISKWNQNP